MSSYTLTFSGCESILDSHFPTNIDLSHGKWALGFLSIETYHTVPNITQENNHFYYRPGPNAELTLITIPEGAYSLQDLEEFIHSHLPDGTRFYLRGNRNTQQIIINSNVEIDFQAPNTIRELIGFEPITLDADTTYASTQPINLTRLDVLRINCNLVGGTFDNGAPSHILHEFFPSVPPGYKIIEAPQTVIYLPITIHRVSTITISLTDHENKLLDFRGERINIRLHLKRL